MTQKKKKFITLCADDYGYFQGPSSGILQLVLQKRINAVSCIVTSENWLAHARQLQPYFNQIDVGLHFNLTDGKPLSQIAKDYWPDHLPKHITLFGECIAKKIPKNIIYTELQAQINQFTQAFGCLPDYIDGHQHIHQFPIIRDVLIEVIKQQFGLDSVYVRVPNAKLASSPAPINKLKILMIRHSGAIVLEKKLKAANIDYNSSFAGVYSFSMVDQYPQLFKQFLQYIDDRGLLMCHAGLSDPADPMHDVRQKELNYLSSQEFLDDCARYSITLAPRSPKKINHL